MEPPSSLFQPGMGLGGGLSAPKQKYSPQTKLSPLPFLGLGLVFC